MFILWQTYKPEEMLGKQTTNAVDATNESLRKLMFILIVSAEITSSVRIAVLTTAIFI